MRGAQQLFGDATFGMECAHPRIPETSQRKTHRAPLVMVFSFSQVPRGWQLLCQAPWGAAPRAEGQQRDELAPSSLGTGCGCGQGVGWPQGTGAASAPRFQPPAGHTAASWLLGHRGMARGLCCSPVPAGPAGASLRGSTGARMGTQGRSTGWHSHAGGAFPSISPVNIQLLL